MELNCKNFEKILKTIFEWEKSNTIEFDDLKSELIYFERTKNESNNSITLFNQTILKSFKTVKYLEVWLDKKLNFKTHVKNRLMLANRALFAIANLMKSKWRLSVATCCQLYMSCIIFISDYDSEIWYHDEKQKHFEQMFQKNQNFAIQKILNAFKTFSIQAIKVETNLLSLVIRFAQKNQIYAVRIAKMKENNSLFKICSSTFTQNFENIEYYTKNSRNVKWNEKSEVKKHSIQLIKILHSISHIKMIDEHIWLKNSIKIQKS